MPRFRAAAGTGRAVHNGRKLDFRGCAEHGLLEIERQFVAQVGPAKGAGAAATATAEDVAEHLAEDVAEGVRRVEARAAATRRVEAGMAELVVGGPFPRVGQDLVGLLGLLEALLGLLVLEITVRMVLHGQASEGAPDIVLGRIARHRQHLVVVAFRH